MWIVFGWRGQMEVRRWDKTGADKKKVRLSLGYFLFTYCGSALWRSLYIRPGNLGIAIASNCHQLITTDHTPAAGWLSSTLFMWTRVEEP
jgi:hypothetical protein